MGINRKKDLHPIILVIILLFITNIIPAQIPKKPNPPRLVNDYSNILNVIQRQNLEEKLVAFNDSTSTQIAVVIINSLNGIPKSDFAYEIGQKWGVGDKNFNNGIVILVKPKLDNEKGQVFIATGYGLEAVIPDAISKRIIINEMIPSFKNNNYYKGIDDAVNTIMALASGEYSKDEYLNEEDNFSIFSLLPFIIILLLFFLIIKNSNNKKGRGGNRGGHGRNGVNEGLLGYLIGSSMGRSSGGWGGHSSGGGSFGGGGFGGFGGGSFGGGGAGGSW